MQNKTEYEIRKPSELNNSQVEQAIALFVDGFYYIYEKAVSRNKEVLMQLFTDTFDSDMVFVCLHEEKIIGFLGLGNNIKRCVTLNKETCKRLFGKFKGTLIYLQMSGMLHEITVHGTNEGYIDYVTTSSDYRHKGIATKLIRHVCETLSYKSYSLDVLSKNKEAKGLYEHLGFVETKIKKNLLVILSGMGYQIVMKLEVDRLKTDKKE